MVATKAGTRSRCLFAELEKKAGQRTARACSALWELCDWWLRAGAPVERLQNTSAGSTSGTAVGATRLIRYVAQLEARMREMELAASANTINGLRRVLHTVYARATAPASGRARTSEQVERKREPARLRHAERRDPADAGGVPVEWRGVMATACAGLRKGGSSACAVRVDLAARTILVTPLRRDTTKAATRT
jgi:hypothetical protein